LVAHRGEEAPKVKLRVDLAIWGIFLAGAGVACAWYYSLLLASGLQSFLLGDASDGLDYSIFLVVAGTSVVALIALLGPYVDRRFPPGRESIHPSSTIAVNIFIAVVFCGIGIFQLFTFMIYPLYSSLAQGVFFFFMGFSNVIVLPMVIRKRQAWKRVQPRLAAELGKAERQFASDPSIVFDGRESIIEVSISGCKFTIRVQGDYPRSPPLVDCLTPALWDGHLSPRLQEVQREMSHGAGLQLAINPPTRRNQKQVPCTLTGWQPEDTIGDIVALLARWAKNSTKME
jgi:hypothetical protein